MVRPYITSALKVGPLSMMIFFLCLYGIENTNSFRMDDFLMFFLLGSCMTTIMAMVASFVVYGVFELVQKYYHLRLSAPALFHFFLPVLLFGFGSIVAITFLLIDDPFSISLAISSFLSSVFGWCFYCYSKAQVEQALFPYPSRYKKI